MLHSALEKVAQIMDGVKFIELEAYEAKPGIDPICLPVILVYRGGELVRNEVRFTDGMVGVIVWMWRMLGRSWRVFLWLVVDG
jgi:hypothetical protein